MLSSSRCQDSQSSHKEKYDKVECDILKESEILKMEFKIRIRNVLLYDNESKTRISYELVGNDVFSENNKFKGVADCELYINKNIFTSIDLQDLKDNLVWNLSINEVVNPTNPMKTRRVATRLENKNIRIDLE